MLRQLIGSSNVYRTYKHEDFSEYPKYQMVNCTSKEVFMAALDNIGDGKGEVIISVLENILCDSVKEITDPEGMDAVLEGAIKEYLTLIKGAAAKRPEVKFALAQPSLRPLHKWFTEGHDAFCRKLGEGIRTMDRQNVGKIDGPIKMSQTFENDGVHLTVSAGKVFVNALLYNADAFFNTDVINLEEEMEVDGARTEKIIVSEKNQVTKRISLVELELANLKEDIIRRREDDCLVSARIREELDFFSNARKEDRIVVTGLTSQIPAPVAVEEKKKWLKGLVGEILNQVEGGSSDHILNVIQGWSGPHSIPLAEVRMDSGDLASRLRKQFAIKKRGGHDFGRAYLANSVTLGTRVRIEILKAMAKCFATEREVMYVSAFSSRPLLHVRPKGSEARQMAYTFADALARYGKQLRQSDLGDAYRRAGIAFKGQLQQNFVVLYDSCPGGNQRAAGSSVWVPSGRPQTKRKMPEEGAQRGSNNAGKRGKVTQTNQN